MNKQVDLSRGAVKEDESREVGQGRLDSDSSLVLGELHTVTRLNRAVELRPTETQRTVRAQRLSHRNLQVCLRKGAAGESGVASEGGAPCWRSSRDAASSTTCRKQQSCGSAALKWFCSMRKASQYMY